MATHQGLPKDSGWYLLFTFIGTFVVLISFDLDLQLLLRWGMFGLLGLATFTFVLNSLGPKVSAWWYSIFPKTEAEEKGLPEEELASQRQSHRERIQEDYKEKASKYQEEILNPREEAKQEQSEKEFYHFTGPAWKGKAERLGDPDEDPNVRQRKRAQGSSKDAVSARKLPESVTTPPPQPEPEPEKPKRIITLPDEPDEHTSQCITVAMRGVTGKVKKRRFLYTNQVQVLIDWMTKQGYHPQIYTLCTTYPKKDLYQHALQSLEEMGIVRDTLVVVEEREERLPDEDMLGL
ncbi:UBX domain-containing protein 8-like [Amphiura filiformis]|uniref:UBX domain-containing protein 8-like n=1 Tax=Amphiura filiformis TaxID=82378 RepID=UPI003B21B6CF